MTTLQRVPEHELMDGDDAAAYADADFAEVNAAYVDRLFELVGPSDQFRILDLGTGPGDIPLKILRSAPAWSIVALDGSEDMLELARAAELSAGLQSPIEWICADAKHTGLPDASFDIIISNSILHHVSSAAVFWCEVKRVASPGCLIFMRDLHRPADRNSARQLVDQHTVGASDILKREFFNSLLAAYTCDEVREQLSDVDLNLSVEKVTDRHFDIFGRV